MTRSSLQVELAASLQQREGEKLRCLACSRGCLLPDQGTGYCTAIVHQNGSLYSTAYGVIGEVSVTPIENRPIYHYRPGTRVLCLGGLGCNLRCSFCQNWEVAFRDARHGGQLSAPNLLPAQAIALARAQDCAGIAWTFNEPSIMPMYLLDSARLAHQAGLYTVMVTNGMMTRQALDLLGPHIDVYRVDVKSLDAAFYRRVANTQASTEIIPLARQAQQDFGIHVEAVTNLMPTLNDSDDHLARLADALVSSLGSNVPWHLTTYVPYAHMKYIPTTPAATLARARAIGLRAGLRFVYTDDIAAANTAHTICPGCHASLIEREAHQVKIRGLGPTGACLTCGTDLAMVLA
ncbi:MAG TPA: AmmeMemoRadiSam system radical SAM enzyme [Ktedonobacteraceae bacterium]